MKLTVIIPVYNEIKTLKILINKVLETQIEKQVIVVDDCSDDGSREEILNHFNNKIDKFIIHDQNMGKGAAIKSAKKYIEGEYVIIQDADLEYDPDQFIAFMAEVKKRKIDALYGSRVLKKKNLKECKTLVIKLGYGEIFF